ncbi:Unknown protein [Striga hermonthica]|uniref:Uncharacterized protein n=1 Tax=Striga hermonthica TaxID=68872 RepID=A0A9N7NFJ4_STRHE|nr:Unknown protein [Striga hermonthica]
MASSNFLYRTLIRSTASPTSRRLSAVKARHIRCFSTLPKRSKSRPEHTPSDVEARVVERIEDYIHSIIVQRSRPDWLPFVPRSSFWVPPRPSSYGVSNAPTVKENLSTVSMQGWPSSDFYLPDEKPTMSFISRLSHQLIYGSFRQQRIFSSLTSPKPMGLMIRHFSQPARLDNEDEEIEIDQRRLPTDYDPSNFDPTEHRSPPSERVWRLVDEISGLTLIETVELSSIMMRKLSMKEMPVIGIMKPGSVGPTSAMAVPTAA